jgi:hypothetical protein
MRGATLARLAGQAWNLGRRAQLRAIGELDRTIPRGAPEAVAYF